MKYGLNNINREKITTCLFAAVGIGLFLPIKISSILIMVALAFSLTQPHFIARMRSMGSNRISLLFGLFYLLLIISAWNGENLHLASSNIERRLSFLIFPILFATSITPSQIKTIVLSFSYASVLSLVYCLIVAVYYAGLNHQIDSFFYHNLSAALGINAIYLSMYFVFSIFVLMLSFDEHKGLVKKLTLIAIIFLSLGVLLLSSKNLLLVLLVGVVVILIQKHKAIKVLIWLIPIFLLAISQVKPVKDRFITEINADLQVVQKDTFRYDTPFTGLTLRLVLWKCSFEILDEKNAWLWGVGIGDFQDLLNRKYIQKGIYTGNPALGETGYLGYNPHNMWVEIILALGIIGALVMAFLFVYSAYYFYTQHYFLGLLLLLIFTSLSFTECVLSSNKGIVFFSFFILLFSHHKSQNF